MFTEVDHNEHLCGATSPRSERHVSVGETVKLLWGQAVNLNEAYLCADDLFWY